jgi:hypothetical protein
MGTPERDTACQEAVPSSRFGERQPIFGLGQPFLPALGQSVSLSYASNYTYAEATWTQGLSDWIAAHGAGRIPCRPRPRLNFTCECSI